MQDTNLEYRKALEILSNISQNWNEDEVEEYEATMSFDELVAELSSIRFK